MRLLAECAAVGALKKLLWVERFPFSIYPCVACVLDVPPAGSLFSLVAFMSCFVAFAPPESIVVRRLSRDSRYPLPRSPVARILSIQCFIDTCNMSTERHTRGCL